MRLGVDDWPGRRNDTRSRLTTTRMSWLIPSLLYILLIGALGVTTKIALRHLTWQAVILWTAVIYAAVSIIMLATGAVRVRIGAGTTMGILSGALAIGGLIAFFVALGHGDASRVVPVSSAYPLVTLILSAIVLSERVTPVRVLASILVVGGVALLSAS